MKPRASKVRIRLAFLGALVLIGNGVVFAAVTWPRLSSVRRAETRALDVSKRRAAL